MNGGLASPERLRGLFGSRSLALVGASDTSGWARNVYQSLRTAGFDGEFVPVHPRHPTVFGIPSRPSLRDLDRPVDLAFALVPTDAVEGVVEDAAAAGVRNVVVLAAGFGERGEDGRRRERRLVDMACAHGITLLGPNGLGFINATDRIAPYGLSILPPLQAGPVGVVLQSGALASAVQAFACNHAIGLSLLVSMGNEAMVTSADVIEYLIEDAATRVIALFLEGIRQPDRFVALARRAMAAGKPIVALKVGRSPGGREVALAHTGAVAGDDAVVDAALRGLGVIRVGSLEELLVTAGLLGYAPPLPGPRMGVITASGGACDIIADRAHEEGVAIPAFAPATIAALTDVLPPFIEARNPVDVTGFGLAHAADAMRPVSGALEAATHDAGVDFVLLVGLTAPNVPPPDPDMAVRRLDRQVAIIDRSPVPVLCASTTCTDVSSFARELLVPRRIHQLAGLDLGLAAIGHAVRWHGMRASRAERPSTARAPAPSARGAPAAPAASGVWAETDGRRLLEWAGVPVVPAEVADGVDGALRAAAALGYPVALKVCAPGIAHKSDAGGVVLGVAGPDELRDAFPRVASAFGGHAPVLISPMRVGGVELLAGVTVDRTFGPVLAVGLGGIFAEVLRDVALRPLPVAAGDVREMLHGLRGAVLLNGARGTAPVDEERLADVLVRLTTAAEALGPRLEALEVNPLHCASGGIEALDVLVITKEA